MLTEGILLSQQTAPDDGVFSKFLADGVYCAV